MFGVEDDLSSGYALLLVDLDNLTWELELSLLFVEGVVTGLHLDPIVLGNVAHLLFHFSN
jgi:hypothetical protein